MRKLRLRKIKCQKIYGRTISNSNLRILKRGVVKKFFLENSRNLDGNEVKILIFSFLDGIVTHSFCFLSSLVQHYTVHCNDKEMRLSKLLSVKKMVYVLAVAKPVSTTHNKTDKTLKDCVAIWEDYKKHPGLRILK